MEKRKKIIALTVGNEMCDHVSLETERRYMYMYRPEIRISFHLYIKIKNTPYTDTYMVHYLYTLHFLETFLLYFLQFTVYIIITIIYRYIMDHEVRLNFSQSPFHYIKITYCVRVQDRYSAVNT